MLDQLMKMMGGSGSGKGPGIMSIFKMLTPFLTDKNIQSVVPDVRAFIQEEQNKVGGKLVISGELSDDGAELNVIIWRRDPQTGRLSNPKRLDLFTLTQQQIKDFTNGIAAAAKQ